MQQWEKEFGTGYLVPLEILNLVEQGLLEDDSWRQDAMPRFKQGQLEMWVNHPNREMREDWDYNRFSVYVMNPDHPYRDIDLPFGATVRPDTCLYDGDSVTMALRAMGFNGEWDHRPAEPVPTPEEEQPTNSLNRVNITINGEETHGGYLTNSSLSALLWVFEAGNQLGDDLG